MGEPVDVVHQRDVDAIEAQPHQARFERTHHAVIGIVIDVFQSRVGDEGARVELTRFARFQQPPDLGRQEKFAARLARQDAPDPRLGKTEP